MTDKFINLNTHSYYSFLQSTLSSEDIVNFSLSNNLEYACLIDINVMYGAYEFYNLCIKNNLKPIIGLQFHYLEHDFIVVAKNYDGYKLLNKLSSEIMNNKTDNLLDEIDDNVFLISLQNDFEHYKITHYIDNNIYNKPVIACQTVNCKNDEDSQVLAIIKAIKDEKKLSYFQINNFVTKNIFLTNEQAKNIFSNEQLLNLKIMVNEINLVIPALNNKINFVKFNENLNSNDYLKQILQEKLDDYLTKNFLLNRQEYIGRMNYELEIIIKQNFSDYFLVVQDFINWAKEQKIMIGPGRGSSSGSLVAFLLNITEIDPIKYNLLFERFLNINRITLPDIDTDVMDTKRDVLIDYLFNKYGIDHVAHIATFSKIKAKQAIRDVGRVLDLNLAIINKICKNIKSDYDEDIIGAVNNSPILKEEYLHYKDLFNYAQKILNFPRQVGVHAAGIILSSTKITDLVAVQSCLNNKNMVQISMDHLSDLGLVKIDILGLRNLTIIDNIIKLIYHIHNLEIDLHKIQLDDQNVFELFHRGDTNGIFQFESEGMRNVMKRIKPVSIEDLSIVSAIFRPGAAANIDLYIKNRKNKDQIEYLNDEIKKILSPTYNIIIYQEQIIQLVQKIANFNPFEADQFRVAISKKREEDVINLKQKFLKNATENGYDLASCNKIFETMLQFAHYGFNHSHSLAYALISYWLAYLKYYYPIESLTVFLTYSELNQQKLLSLLNEAKQFNVKICPPYLNYATTSFVIHKNRIIFSLISIIGLGKEIANKIITLKQKQNNQKFTDPFKTIAMLSGIGVSKTIIIKLIKSGSLDELERNRDLLLANVDLLCDKKMNIIDKDGNFVFDLSLNLNVLNHQNNYEYEKEVLGIGISESKQQLIFNKYKNKFNLLHIDCINDNNFFNTVVEILFLENKINKNNKSYIHLKFNENNQIYYANVFDDLEITKNQFLKNKMLIVKMKKMMQSDNFVIEKVLESIDE